MAEDIKNDETPELKRISYDALLDDVLGLNIMGLKSLWQCFINPRAYFRASRYLDWQGKFTPSFRLWFTLVAITFFFQFFWAGSTSATLQVAISQLEAGASLPEGVTSKMAAKEFLRWSFGFLPFILAFCLFLLAACISFWGDRLSFAERQRRLFIIVIPSTFLSIFLTIALGVAPMEHFAPLLILTYAGAFILDSLTAYRGAFEVPSAGGKIWRAMILGVLTLVTSLLAGLLSNMAAMLAIFVKYQL